MLRGGSGRPVSDFEHILLDLPGPDDHGIATLTLNRPEAMNAFTNVMVREMVAAFDITDACLLYTSPSPRDGLLSRMPSSA